MQEMCCGSSEEGGYMASICDKQIYFSEKSDVRAGIEGWAWPWKRVVRSQVAGQICTKKKKFREQWRRDNFENSDQFLLVGIEKNSKNNKQKQVN